MLIGPAGVGKTTLARDAAERLGAGLPAGRLGHARLRRAGGSVRRVRAAARRARRWARPRRYCAPRGNHSATAVCWSSTTRTCWTRCPRRWSTSWRSARTVRIAASPPASTRPSRRDRGAVAGRAAGSGSTWIRRATTTSRLSAQVDEFVEALPAACAPAAAVPGRRTTRCPWPTRWRWPGRDAVDEAVRSGVVAVDDDRVRPAHPLFVDAVRGRSAGRTCAGCAPRWSERLAAAGGDGVVAAAAPGGAGDRQRPSAAGHRRVRRRPGRVAAGGPGAQRAARTGRARAGTPAWPPGSPSATRWRGRAVAATPTRCSPRSTPAPWPKTS